MHDLYIAYLKVGMNIMQLWLSDALTKQYSLFALNEVSIAHSSLESDTEKHSFLSAFCVNVMFYVE